MQGGFEIDVGTIGDATDLRVEFAGRAKHGVAQFFGGQAARQERGVGFADRIEGGELGAIGMTGAAPVGVTGHDRAMQGFDRPIAFDQFGGEPIEEFGMRGRFAGATKVVGIARDGLTKVPEPNPVDDSPSGEGVVGTSDPFGKGATAALDVRGQRFGRINPEGGEHAGRHGLGAAERIAVGENLGVLEFALGHAVVRHAQRIGDVGEAWRAATVDGEREGFVAFDFPAQATVAFFGHAFVAVVLRGEADRLGWKFIFGGFRLQ